jgi:DNA repair exonuclease SbcCD ATPase subunit
MKAKDALQELSEKAGAISRHLERIEARADQLETVMIETRQKAQKTWNATQAPAATAEEVLQKKAKIIGKVGGRIEEISAIIDEDVDFLTKKTIDFQNFLAEHHSRLRANAGETRLALEMASGDVNDLVDTVKDEIRQIRKRQRRRRLRTWGRALMGGIILILFTLTAIQGMGGRLVGIEAGLTAEQQEMLSRGRQIEFVLQKMSPSEREQWLERMTRISQRPDTSGR